MNKELLQQALYALKNGKKVRNFECGSALQVILEDAAIAALEAAIAQPEQRHVTPTEDFLLRQAANKSLKVVGKGRLVEGQPEQPAENKPDWRDTTTFIKRFGDAMQALCKGHRPADEIMTAWLDPEADDLRLQHFACKHGPSWAQGIGVIDAATVLSDQPTEGVEHEYRVQPEQPADFTTGQEFVTFARPEQAAASKAVAYRYKFKGDLQWQYTETLAQATQPCEIQYLYIAQPEQPAVLKDKP